MNVLNYDEVKLKKESLRRQVSEGALFIYPTDTVYGIGCDATNAQAVVKLRELKNREERPFSVIAPSKDWIHENCVVDGNIEEWLDKLPGPYTLVLKLKNPDSVLSEVNNGRKTIGVRIPQHWISDAVRKFGLPIITTSANKTGKNTMTSLEDADIDLKSNVDFIIYDGPLEGKASKIVDLSKDTAEIIRD